MFKKRSFLFLILLILLSAALFLFLPVFNVLSIQSRNLKSQCFYSGRGYSKGFIISYSHSVNKGRVHDFYKKTEDKKLELYKTTFVSYGAGIPEPEETPGASFSVEGNCYSIENLHRIVPRLVMAVGLIANHSILFETDFKDGQNELMLTDFFAPQTSIILEYKKVSFYKYLRHNIKYKK